MLRFHQTLEELFRKNFSDEIRRISAEGGFEELPTGSFSPARTMTTIQEQGSLYEQGSSHKIQLSLSSSASLTGGTMPLSLGGSSAAYVPMSPSPLSSHGHRRSLSHAQSHPYLHMESPSNTKPTPLQLHAAHVARHGLTGVSTGWRPDISTSGNGPATGLGAATVPGGTPVDGTSPRDSLVTVGNPNGIGVLGANGGAGVSPPLSSTNSIKGRLSRFGSLSLGQRKGGGH